MWPKLLDGGRAVMSCVAYNALFAVAVIVTVFGCGAAAWLAEAAGVPREAAKGVIYLAPVALFALFWFFFLRNAHFDHFGDGGD